MGEEVMPKSKFRMKVTMLERVTDSEGKEGFKVVDSKWIRGNGKEFRESIHEDRDNGIERTIEVVSEEPKKFKINQIYMLATRDVVWIYMEK